jgi:hypothetical protein
VGLRAISVRVPAVLVERRRQAEGLAQGGLRSDRTPVSSRTPVASNSTAQHRFRGLPLHLEPLCVPESNSFCLSHVARPSRPSWPHQTDQEILVNRARSSTCLCSPMPECRQIFLAASVQRMKLAVVLSTGRGSEHVEETTD